LASSGENQRHEELIPGIQKGKSRDRCQSGPESGITIRRNAPNREQPSIIAASSAFGKV
jgi:hypothetical protein